MSLNKSLRSSSGPAQQSGLLGDYSQQGTPRTTPAEGRLLVADLHKAGLGLSEEDEARIVNEVQFVIHSAASISFFEHIHTLLEQNYEVSARSILPLFSHSH